MSNIPIIEKIRELTRKKPVIIARNALYIAAETISVILRAAFAVLLVCLTTMMIFACIFVVYISTNLSGTLDVSLEEFSLNLSSTMYYLDGEGGQHEMATLQSMEHRIWADYEEIPLYMEHALVAIEDHRFYDHHGVDWFRTAAAFGNMFLRMKDTFGGSTITQQLIKNATGEDDVTVARKLEEIFRALEFEKRYSKEEIITGYLNRVFFGGRSYGVAAAADYYFGKTLDELTLAECASIIGITNNPSLYNPYLNRERNKERQELILNAMYKQGYISLAELEEALAEELVFTRGASASFVEETYTWFEESVIDEVTRDFMELRGLSSFDVALSLLTYGGYTIITTLDPFIQSCIDEIYTDVANVPATTGSDQQLQSAIVIMDPYTGHIVGVAGGVGEKTGNRWKNRATSELGRRPPGSSIKPISVYAPAMDLNLITPNTLYDDARDVVLEGRPDWLPRNDDFEYRGIMTVRSAIVQSRNTIAAQVLDRLSVDVSYRFMTNTLGFNLLTDDRNYAPLAVGQLSIGATVKEMASAYTMFPNGGVRSEGITYTQLIDKDGNIVINKRAQQTIAISETTAYWMTSILRDAVTSGTGRGASLGASMPVAGKTGTTTDSRDRWFCGFTPYYVGVVWAGYDIPEPIRLRVNANPSSQLFQRVMSLVHADLPARQFAVPENTYQPPVQGIPMADYTVRYETASGVQVAEPTTARGRVGRELTVWAELIEGYDIVGAASATIMIDENSARNRVTFIYAPTPPPPTPPPENPWDYPEIPPYDDEPIPPIE